MPIATITNLTTTPAPHTPHTTPTPSKLRTSMSNTVPIVPPSSSGHSWRPPPAPGSLRAILLEHCTTRLFVHPLDWDADHLAVLDVDLVISASRGEPVLENVKCQVDESIPILSAIWSVEQGDKFSRDMSTRKLVNRIAELQTLDIWEGTLCFAYENRRIAKLPPIIIALHQSIAMEDLGTPVWAYTDSLWTTVARRKRYGRNKSWDLATKEIKRREGLVIDPVYVAILITLAQQRKHGPPGSTSHRVTLFVPENESVVETSNSQPSTTSPKSPPVHSARAKVKTILAQYIADIPYTYLQKFQDPYEFHASSLHIEKRTLLIKEPATIFQAMKSAFYDAGCSESSPPPATLQQNALEEMNLNTKDPEPQSKRRKVWYM